MSNTLPDATLVSGTWYDAYALTGIATGTPLIIRNKGTTPIYIVVRPTAPAPSSTDGWSLLGSGTFPAEWTTVSKVPTGSKVWLKGNGKVFIQELE
jgi:hypothetical protein